MSEADSSPEAEGAAEGAAEGEAEGEAEGALDLEQRELCPDGSCTGVIGDNGCCRQCGLASDGSGVPCGERVQARDEDGGEDEGQGGDDEGEEDGAGTGAALDEERELCLDGTCVGLIGADRRCKVCGRAAE